MNGRLQSINSIDSFLISSLTGPIALISLLTFDCLAGTKQQTEENSFKLRRSFSPPIHSLLLDELVPPTMHPSQLLVTLATLVYCVASQSSSSTDEGGYLGVLPPACNTTCQAFSNGADVRPQLLFIHTSHPNLNPSHL